MHSRAKLNAIKAGHTLIWAFFVVCIAAIPVAAQLGQRLWALVFIAIVMVEVVILALNRWRCPLTDLAARYTDQRQANFDIFLPLWVARYNQWIFGPLFVAGMIYALWRLS